MKDLSSILAVAGARHKRLCPRQVLGARMGIAGAQALGLDVPRTDKALLVIAETDGCFVDGLEAAAGVSVGRRTLRVEDFGKVAATFVDVHTGEAVRLAPQPGIREAAFVYAPGAPHSYAAQLVGYQVMPDEALFTCTPVALTASLASVIGRPGVRINCAGCGEEIINGREVLVSGLPHCRSCAGPSYYQPVLIRESMPALAAEPAAQT